MRNELVVKNPDDTSITYLPIKAEGDSTVYANFRDSIALRDYIRLMSKPPTNRKIVEIKTDFTVPKVTAEGCCPTNGDESFPIIMNVRLSLPTYASMDEVVAAAYRCGFLLQDDELVQYLTQGGN